MFLNPRTPVIIGILLILLLGRLLMEYSPMPGNLSRAHARIEGMSLLTNCSSCHHADGMTQGCLECHEEIAGQLSRGEGYHHYLFQDENVTCAKCHAEHAGGGFPLVSTLSWGPQNPNAFRHPHVDFLLEGKHDTLACSRCHAEDQRQKVHLAAFPNFTREKSFLNVSQDCAACHPDVHSDGLSGDCGMCHGQHDFRPANFFDHGVFFPLEGGHDRVACRECHVLPAAGEEEAPLPFPFDKVAGKTCAQCHDSPHRAAFPVACEQCHSGSHPLWTSAAFAMTAPLHEATGFRLAGPHADVDCDQCHAPALSFAERHPDAEQPGYARREETCQGCHDDVHDGQFASKYDACIDCHEQHRFLPTQFGTEAHEALYPLEGAHGAVPCVACHTVDAATQVREFVGTSRECKTCHDDPHGGQFSADLAAGDCTGCHEDQADTFAIRPYDHEAHTGYGLEGAHALATCETCHEDSLLVAGPNPSIARLYRGTPQECSTCHKDVHLGQFQEDGRTTCSACHGSFSDWKNDHFDHDTQSRFPLEGAHAVARCSACHLTAEVEGVEIVQYKPLGRECGDCHEIAPSSPSEKNR